jgi:hypothetical protein
MTKAALLTLIVFAVLLLAAGKWIVDGLKGIATPTKQRRARFA